MQKILGTLLLIAGIYFLGQNIMFSTYYSPFFWRNLPAIGSVLCILGGTTALMCFPRQTGSLGWILLILGIMLVFLSGGVFLKPTSLWNFMIASAALISGYKLLTERSSRF
jgi:hypothetical protein